MRHSNRTRYALFSLIGMGLLASLTVMSCKEKTPETRTDSTSSTTTTTSTTGDTSHTTTSAATTDSAKTVEVTGKALDGQKLFYNASAGKVKVACAGCHTDGTSATKDTRIRAGHTLAGVTSRTATWNGMYKGADLKTKAYGGVLCAAMYQKRADGNVDKALSAQEVEALNAYFDAIQNAPGAITKNIAIQWGTKPAFSEGDAIDDKAARAAAKAILKLPGDAGNGKTLFGRTCTYCHSLTERKIGPAFTDAFKDAENVAKVLRCGYNAMPFYGKDILSDQQLADVMAYIQGEVMK